jgi:photosystem II stability/assembly factor-like uncharacterized protein
MKPPAGSALLVFMLILWHINSPAQGWQWSNPWPQGNSLLSVHFINNDTGFAVGYNGTILGTTDAGASWSVTFHSSQATFNCVHFLDEQLVLACGTGGRLLRTTDLGAHWDDINIPSGSDLKIVQVVNDSLAYLVGNDGTSSILFRSSDAGLTWETRFMTNRFFTDIFATGTDTVFALGGYGIYRSLDGGNTWPDSVFDGGYIMYSLYFTNHLHGVATGGNYGYDFYIPHIMMTEDGGETWTEPLLYIPLAVYHRVSFGSDLTGYAVGRFGKDYIIKTLDGGHTWEEMSASESRINDFCFPGESIGYSVGNNGPIQMTADGAASWQSVSRQVMDDFRSIYFTEPGKGFVCGDNSIASTTDNGKEWQKVQFLVYPDSDLSSIDFSSPTDGFAAGDNCMYYTRDGGTTWTWQHAGSWKRYNCLDIPPGSDSGYMVGKSGSIVRFNLDLKDLFWQFQPTGLFETELFSVHFPVPDTGYVTAEDGIILRTTNGGAYWEHTQCGMDVDLHSVFFLDTKTGWASGKNGTILKTSDGGNSWVKQASGTEQTINMIKFLDDSFGYAIGNAGTILKSVDGGEDWTMEWAPCSNDLHGLFIFDTNNIYACGKNNTILKLTTGGSMAADYRHKEHSSPILTITPNPFRQRARITFWLDDKGNTEMTIHDITGKGLHNIFDETLYQGWHQLDLDLGSLATGLYFIRLSSKNGTVVEKFIIGR